MRCFARSRCAPACQRALAVTCRASAVTRQPRGVARTSPSLIRSLASAAAIQGAVQRFESLAGRSAMVGVATAALVEVFTDQGVFSAIAADGPTYAAYIGATVAASAALACARAFTVAETGKDLLEAVYASLTAVGRSASSVTEAQHGAALDSAIDFLLDGDATLYLLGVDADD